MSKEKMVPEIRFEGFDGEWEKCRIEDTLTVNSGRDYKHLQSGSIPVYGTGGYMLSVNDALSYEDSIGIGRKGTIDSPQKLLAPFWTVDTLFFMTLNRDYHFDFMFSLMETIPWRLYDESTGVPSLSRRQINGIEVKVPSFREQSKIGLYMSELDNNMKVKKKQLSQLKNFKQAMLQKMFPKEGETVPEVRFKGFEKEWETKNIRDIAGHTLGGGTPSTNTDEYWNGNIPWLQSSDVKEDNVLNTTPNKFVTNKGISNSATKLVPRNSIAIVTRVGVGKVAFIPYEFTTSQDFLSLTQLNLDPLFAAYLLYTKMQQNKSNTQGSAIKGITSQEVLNQQIFVPQNLNEQILIGSYFEDLDENIENKQKELHKLKQFKQAMLDKMFV